MSGVSGLDSAADGRGFVLFDYDRDGWQDIALVNTNPPLLSLYRNELSATPAGQGKAGRFIALRFNGGNRSARPSREHGNRDGYGALVTLSLGESTIVREHRAGEGFGTQNSATMLIGIGDRAVVNAVSVRWPSGKVQRIERVAADTLLTVHENPADAPHGAAFAQHAYVQPRGKRPPDPTRAKRLAPRLKLRPSAARAGSANGPPPLRMYTTMATWCASCKKELPQTRFLRAALSSNDVAMYGVPIDPDDSTAKLDAYVAAHRPGYRLLTDLSTHEVAAVQDRVLAEFDSELLPSTIITDRDGLVLRTIAGLPTLSDLRKLAAAEAQGAD